MPDIDAAGLVRRIVCRNAVTSADTATPTGNPSGAVLVPASARGGTLHVYVDVAGSGASPSVAVTLFGYQADAGAWYALGQLNAGSVIAQTTNTPIAPQSNAIRYAESVLHVTAYDMLYAMVSSFTNVTSVTVAFGFEAI